MTPIEYDPRRPDIIADPYPVFAVLRDRDPVHWSDVLGGWVLTRYDDVKAALNDPRLSADRITPFMRHREASGQPIPDLARLVGRWAVFTDPPAHTRLRGLMNRAFTGGAVAALGPRIAEIVDELIGGLPDGKCDLVRDFAYPLPVTVIADMIGVPPTDRTLFKQWSDALATFVGSNLLTADKYERADSAAREMTDYFRAAIAARRQSRRDDILSALIAAEEDQGVLSEDELVACCVLLLFAGHETTTNLIANGLYALLSHPEASARYQADPGLDEPMVEEALRFDGPAQAMVRIVAAPFTLHGRSLAAGERVFTMINAANRDRTVFDQADRFVVDRIPNRHIAFGYGIHFCLGAPLARLEGRIAFRRLVDRLVGLRPATDAPEWIDSLVFRGMRALPMAYDSIRAAG